MYICICLLHYLFVYPAKFLPQILQKVCIFVLVCCSSFLCIQRSFKPWFTKSAFFIYFLFDSGCLFISSGPYFWCLDKIRIHVFFVLVSSRVFVCCSACLFIQQISGVLHKVFIGKQNPGHHQYLKTMDGKGHFVFVFVSKGFFLFS